MRRITRPVSPSKITKPAKLAVVANRVVGMVKPSKPEPSNDPSEVRPGHHVYK